MAGLTFDTGALLALENRTTRMIEVVRAANDDARAITVPTAVVSEWWQGRPGQDAGLLDAVEIEPLSFDLALDVGVALSRCHQTARRSRVGATKRRRPSLADVIVVVSAARRRDVVYTSDPDDLAFVRDANRLFVRIRDVATLP